MQIHELSARELAAAVRHRRLSATEVLDHTLSRVRDLGERVGAFTVIAEERSRAEAAEVDRRLLAGEELPLAGVPCPIKDLNPVAGLPWEAGSAALHGNVAEVDDGIVGWLREAGTLLVAKTATPEFGLPCYTEPEGRPPARTPWDLTRSAGGSSGGAAAAVAAGIVPIAHASDGGGSIRIPAAACGLVGLKPSRGRISPGPLRDPGPGLATDGVLSRDVRDTALALDVLAGARPGDTYFAAPPAGSFLAACDSPYQRLRVGLLLDPVIAPDALVHEECAAAASAAARQLESLGHLVDIAPVPFPPERWDAFRALWSVGALGIPLPPEAEPLLRPLTRWLRDSGRSIGGLEYAQAAAAVQALTREVARNWAPFDIIVTPTLAQPPAPIGSLRDDADPAADFLAQMRFTPWTSIYNLTGRPAISLPTHRAAIDGVELPIGVMLGARFGEEELLLAVAATLEGAFGPGVIAPHFG